MHARPADDDLARVASLVRTFEHVARTRMAGLPLLHPGLHVAAVDFRPYDGVLVGVLITPWFMSVVRLPRAVDPCAQRVGTSTEHTLGELTLSFVGAHEAELGAFESCSLFSPLFQFKDQAAAEATAEVVMRDLIGPRQQAPAPPSSGTRALDRRGFLFGRRRGTEP